MSCGTSPLETAADIETRIRYTGGVLVQNGPVSTWGHFRIVDEEVQQQVGGGIVAGQTSVTVATGRAGVLEEDALIVVDGELWKTRDSYRLGDGKLTLILLKEP